MKRQTITNRVPLRILAYGKAGSGKTTFAGTAASDERTAPVLWLDAGGNPNVLTRFPEATRANVDVLRIDAVTDLADVFNWLVKGQKPEDLFARDNQLTRKYRTLVFDGYTHIQRFSFAQALGNNDTAPGSAVAIPAWPHYRHVLGQMVDIASKYDRLPIHIIATALEDRVQKPITPGNTEKFYQTVQPLLQGESVDEVPGWFKLVARFVLRAEFDMTPIDQVPSGNEAFTIAQTTRTKYAFAKDQHIIDTPYMANPTIAKILNIIAAKADKIPPVET